MRTALLKKQYFPFVKTHGEELPRLLDSETFTLECAKELAELPDTKHASWTELRTRRFDGLVRRLGIPHPAPYSRLVLHVGNHWTEIAPLLRGAQSQIKPALHEDGRIVQMDYETAETSHSRATRLAHGRRFAIEADVSNCFPSIYSHSVDWATRGKQEAKKQGGQDGSWQAELDKFVRNCHNCETKGVMIGPAISNVIAELVLQRIDEILTHEGHQFIRYVDDYTAYAADRSNAEDFVVTLQRALAHYRLDLNTRKTRITDLHDGLGEEWMGDIWSRIPPTWSPLSAARFLRQAELLATRHPRRSVLKFAVKTMMGRREGECRGASHLIVDELVRLCTFHPHLAPFLAHELEALGDDLDLVDANRLRPLIVQLMSDAIRRAETDTVLWYLYILRCVLRCDLLKCDWQPLVQMDDDLVMLAVAAWCRRARRAVEKRVVEWEYDYRADYEQHWLLRYELYRTGILKKAELACHELQWMSVLDKHEVQLSELA